jgi:hypothetical protein
VPRGPVREPLEKMSAHQCEASLRSISIWGPVRRNCEEKGSDSRDLTPAFSDDGPIALPCWSCAV